MKTAPKRQRVKARPRHQQLKKIIHHKCGCVSGLRYGRRRRVKFCEKHMPSVTGLAFAGGLLMGFLMSNQIAAALGLGKQE